MKLCRALSDLVVYTNSVAAQDIVDDGTGLALGWHVPCHSGEDSVLLLGGTGQSQSPAGHSHPGRDSSAPAASTGFCCRFPRATTSGGVQEERPQQELLSLGSLAGALAWLSFKSADLEREQQTLLEGGAGTLQLPTVHDLCETRQSTQ